MLLAWLRAKSNIIIALVLALLSLALYIKTLAPTVLMADGGEFQFVPYLAGVAHPTGYPLYTMLGWLWTHVLPLGEVAYRLNLLSALWAALTVGLLYLTIELALREFDLAPVLSSLAAALGAVCLAVSGTFWSQAVIAEVYSLNAFFVTLVLYLLLRAAANDASSATCLLLVSFAYGLSLTHHRTMILLLPAIFVFLWLAEGLPSKCPALWKGAALFLLPLLLYLYIPWRAPHTPYLRLSLGAGKELILYHNTLSGLLDHVLGRVFGGQLGPWEAGRLSLALDLLAQQFGWVGLGLGVVGLLRLLFSQRWPLLALTGLAYLVGVAFNLVYFIGDVYVLFIPSYLVFALWLALGAVTLAQGAGRAVRYPASVVVVVALFFLPLGLTISHYPQIDQSRNYQARELWKSILAEPLPQGAILVSNDRDEIMPMWYYQYVEGARPDLVGLFPLIVPQYENVVQVVDGVLDTGRPVYLIKEMPGLEVKYQLEAAGAVVRVVSPAVEGAPQHPQEIVLAETVRLVGYDQEPYRPRPGDNLHVSLYWQAVGKMEGAYSSFVHLVDGEGQTVAQSDHQPGGDFYPTTLWQPGETLRDEHLIEIPAHAPPGDYGLWAGMYLYPSMEPLGERVFIGEVNRE